MKRKFEDIIPSDKRSIRNIPLPVRDEKGRPEAPKMDGIRTRHSVPARTIHHEERAKVFKPEVEASAIASKAAVPQATAHQAEPSESHKHALPVRKTVPAYRDVSSEKRRNENTENYRNDRNGENGDDSNFGETKKPRWRAWTLIVVVLLVVGYFASSYFARASINISLTPHDIPISSVTVPLKDMNYTVVSVESSKSAVVQANGSQKISNKATGKVVIYNVSSSADQKLLINTRLETLDGHIYRTDDVVTVPAVRVVNGKKLAGSVEVNITADQPGEAYNLGLKDFNLPGFKDTDKYTAFYARSKTPLSGGFVGTAPNISQTDLANAVAKLKKDIEADGAATLAKKVAQEATAEHDFVYINGGEIIEYANTDIKQSSDGKTANVTVTGTITGLGLSNSDLAALLVKSDTMPQSAPETATTSEQKYSGDFSKVTIKIPQGMSARSLMASLNDLNSTVSVVADGTANIVSKVDEGLIAQSVSHLSREQAVDAVKGIVDVNMIEVSVIPWWLRTLPSSDRIRVNIEK